MRDGITNWIDATGLGTVLMSAYMNITELLNVQSWNKVILFLTSIFGLIYLIMKIYHLYLETREKRKKLGRKGII